jgi:hypothetical protein
MHANPTHKFPEYLPEFRTHTNSQEEYVSNKFL